LWGDNNLFVPDDSCEPVAGRPPLALERVARGIDTPVYLTSPPGDRRLFVVSREDGEVLVLDRDGTIRETFLSIADEIGAGSEQGLLSIAFHPQYATNGRFFISWARRSDAALVVEEWRVSDSNRDRANPARRRVMFEIDHTADFDYGGHLAFGPDGYLYIASGDGGPHRDPEGHAQSLGSLRGKLLRVDVDGDEPYAIPDGNPFVEQGGARDEIFAYGLRNPWRFAFDSGGALWIGDVGFSSREEVDVAAAGGAGLDFGWNVLEGDRCLDGTTTCDQTGKEAPVWVYPHTDAECAVILGPAYRGCDMPDRHDEVFIADHCAAWVKTLRLDDAGAIEITDEPGLQLPGAVGGFGEDSDGNVYILDHARGTIDRIVPAP
jgi:hypothetical protein